MELCMNGVCDMIAKAEANSIESVKEASSAGLVYEVRGYYLPCLKASIRALTAASPSCLTPLT